MGLFDWLKRLLLGAPAQPLPLVRDVSRLDADQDDIEAVHEPVDTSGGPLKPSHRRRALRDPRLLPKPKPKPQQWGTRRKRQRVMSKDEANRLFGATLRTRNRALRDLLPDEEQLARYGLPVWKTEPDVAAALGLTVPQLRGYTVHRFAEKTSHYVMFAKPKRSGGRRIIHAPKKRLKAIQRNLLDLLVRRLPIGEHAHGFRVGRSIRTGAAAHVGKAVVLRLDLKDFFPSVTFARVRGLLIALGYGYVVATVLAVLMTEAERQPVDVNGVVFQVPVGPRYCVQGAPTSPGLCNAIAVRLDRRLAGLAKKHGFAYTRYADDLCFSGDGDVDRVRKLACRIIRDEGFTVNAAKTRVARRHRRQAITGVVVNTTLGLPRTERRRLRALIHRHGKDQAAGQSDPKRLAHIRGKLAYLKMLNPEQAAALQRRLMD